MNIVHCEIDDGINDLNVVLDTDDDTDDSRDGTTMMNSMMHQ